MRLSIRHETTYTYGSPAAWSIATLRLAPRGYAGQSVGNWRVEVDHDCRVDQSSDAFGNILHSFTANGPLERLSIVATGDVETSDTHGVIQGQVERFPEMLFLRDTSLTEADDAIRALADVATAPAAGDPIGMMHGFMKAIRDSMHFDTGATDVTTTATQALSLGHGVCQDFAHIFIAGARHLGFPTRYVGGYLYQKDEADGQEAGHGWAEAYLPDLGWVGFDPANAVCPTEAYVRVAVGLDYLGAAPVRGSRHGGSDEKLTVQVSVKDAGFRAR